MKKILGGLLSVLLLCGIFSVISFAAGPKDPVIVSQSSDFYLPQSGSDLTLFAEASSPDGGTLEYQWYSTYVEDIATIRAIDDATESTYQVPKIVGIRWYCYAVWNVSPSGIKSDPVYSNLIRVEFYEGTGLIPATPIINSQMPDCYVPLDGTILKLYSDAVSPDGGTLEYQWYSTSVADISTIRAIDGATDASYRVPDIEGVRWYCYAVWNVAASGAKSTPVYSRLIRVEFYEQTHVHQYGEWFVTTNPTCTEAGIKMRECDCGDTQRGEVQALGHTWDGGKVTKEPTAYADGEKTFTCIVCKETKVEKIKATGTASPSQPGSEPETTEVETSESTSPENVDESETETETDRSESDSEPDTTGVDKNEAETDRSEPDSEKETTEAEASEGTSAASDDETSAGKKHASPLLWVITAVIAVILIGGGVTGGIILMKKKR